jgi:hypothetical protein
MSSGSGFCARQARYNRFMQKRTSYRVISLARYFSGLAAGAAASAA